jgi:hypothetical protein
VDQVHNRWTEAEVSVHHEPCGGADSWSGGAMSELCREAALGRGCSPLGLEEGKENSGVSFWCLPWSGGGEGAPER